MKLLLVTDAWKPQVNGVVRSYLNTIPELEKMGMEVQVIHPELFKLRFSLPSYNEIKIVVTRQKTLKNMIKSAKADYIHTAPEGPLGYLARNISANIVLEILLSAPNLFLNVAPNSSIV